ncbi:MAG: US12 family protein [Clostridia bacterium]|nr:US12 family protein [Clostridia bacterium]
MTTIKDRKRLRLESGLPDSVSARVYNCIIGALVLYGFAMNALFVDLFSDKLVGMENSWILIIVYLVCVIAGSLITRSSSPVISFLGYNLIVIPIGLLLAVMLPGYPKSDVLSAIIVTGAVVVGMIAFATLKPDFFAKLGRVLFLSLILGAVCEVIAVLLGYGGNLFNWLFVIIFSLYLGYDWHRAQVYPKTIDNAVDSTVDIYLDIINIFIRVLSLLNRND